MKRWLLPAFLAALTVPTPSFAADWKGSFDASYQAASPGDTITVPAGTYGKQVIGYRANVANLANGCTVAAPAKCIRFVMSGPVTLNGPLEIRGSSVWIQGGAQLVAKGYVDTEADSVANHPDHVVVEGTRSPSFGVFNADTVHFRDMDVGPATVTGANCGIREGVGQENKIGFGGGVTYVPRNIVLERLKIHDQNGDKGRELGDCHWGGLFLVTADGLTVKDSVFEANVVYHVQIQNFGGAPAAKRVVFDHNSFSCPADWIYVAVRCDGQKAVQFDYDPAGQFTLTNNVAANGTNGLYGCYVGNCGNFSSLIQSGNVDLANSLVAPPLLGGNPPPPPPPPVCPGPSLSLTVVAQDATTVTFAWTPVANATGYRFSRSDQAKRSHTWDAGRSTVKFGKIQGGGCYRVEALGVIADGGSAG